MVNSYGPGCCDVVAGVQVGRTITKITEVPFGGNPSDSIRCRLLSEYSVMLCMANQQVGLSVRVVFRLSDRAVLPQSCRRLVATVRP